jgi:hypothetical protein
MNGFLVVEETPQGERIAATIAFLRWILRIYLWVVCRIFRAYHRIYEKLPRPDPYGTIPMPFTPFWSGESLQWIDDLSSPNHDHGATQQERISGGQEIRWPLVYDNPYWIVGSDPAVAELGCPAPGQIVRATQGAPVSIVDNLFQPTPCGVENGTIAPTTSPAQRDPA